MGTVFLLLSVRRSFSLVLLVLLPLLGGCGPRYHWVKNVPQDELLRDRYECERDMRAGAMSFGTGIVGQLNANDFMGRCFQAKGYVLRPVGEAVAPVADPANFNPEYQRAICYESCTVNDLGEACREMCRKSYP